DSLPELLEWLAKRAIAALELAPDWPAILAAVAWVRDHPRSGLFLRQMDAPGVHTKLVEKHRSVISELLDRVLPADAVDATARGSSGFVRRYGFREKPERIRIRFLDSACAIAPDRIGLDLTLDSAAFAVLDPPVDRVFITENEVNFLAFPDCPRSLVIFGSGYGWCALAAASWLHQRAIHYWGDIDTHGFAILDQLRASFPDVRSMLMSRDVFWDHREFWTTEPNPVRHDLPTLTTEEKSTLEALRAHGTTRPPRLEQEKLPFPVLESALQTILRSDG
ncbi:MAG: Wadjet anti-phage system protein JetD domain-containing protein, partial [Luteolibacter sp.]